MNWIRFKDRFPKAEDFPIWVGDLEYETLDLYESYWKFKARVWCRQWCVKKELVWQAIEVPKVLKEV